MTVQAKARARDAHELALHCAKNMGLGEECAPDLEPVISALLSQQNSVSPTEPSVLAEVCVAISFPGHGPPVPASAREAVRAAALKTLTRILDALAASVANGSCQQGYIEDARQHVIEKVLNGKYHIGRFSFRSWAKTVIRNFLRDIEVPHDTNESAERVAQTTPPRGKFFLTAFCESDMEKIRRWYPVRDRILVLVCTGLWHKVAKQERDAWCREAGLDPAGPKGGFPTDPARGRRDAIAEWANMSRSAVDAVISRKIGWLRQLPSIRDLAEGGGFDA